MSHIVDFTTSTISIKVAGGDAYAQKIDLGNNLAFIGGHYILNNIATNANATEFKIENLPSMSTIVSCNVEGLQIGVASSYTSYQHFSANGTIADFYIRNTTAGTSNVEINFFILGVLAS